MKGEIRKAEKGDADAMLKLFNSDPNLIGGDFNYQAKHMPEFITNPVNKTFVYEIDEKIVGVVQTQFWKESQYVYLNDIVVDKNYQRQGIGFELENYVEQLAKKEGYEYIYLFSEVDNKKAHKLFEKGGYKADKKFIFFNKKI